MTVSADGKRYAGHEESEDMYASIDMVMDKIGRQVRDAKDAHTARIRHGRVGVGHVPEKNRE